MVSTFHLTSTRAMRVGEQHVEPLRCVALRAYIAHAEPVVCIEGALDAACGLMWLHFKKCPK